MILALGSSDSPLLSAKDAETLTLRLIEALTPGTLTRNQCQRIDAALNAVTCVTAQ